VVIVAGDVLVVVVQCVFCVLRDDRRSVSGDGVVLVWVVGVATWCRWLM